MRPCRRFHSARSLTGLAQARHRVRHTPQRRSFASTALRPQDHDPRIRELGREISDDYAAIRDSYQTPKYPIVLAHGLLGFSELQLTPLLPSVQYWHGIRDALAVQGARVICASVPPSSSIEDRAKKLREDIDAAASTTRDGRVNIIAHSMGGLDARYMISHLPPKYVDIASLVTVASPHRGSSFADVLLQEDGQALVHLPKLYGLIERFGLGTAAFAQLTTSHMTKVFNPATPDSPSTRYFSYGASTTEPPLLSPFRQSWHAITKAEGANDGLVAVDSSCWGDYKGTLVGVSHLDLINWSNQVKWMVREWMGMKRTFNAIAFYLDVADMLAKEGL
ncbi:Alpha/Beta hydrolase protein [Emericellopsis atlantica]|uniref:Alpha/Beta hydrolase protein n=1 Tax=Emericellopsis atlantica TaxID=2614577 RepID=A0A9P8CKC5_9HYPO|nr:Alpha/Beta hydrolase protein [Emericellopsis atlantica]KAG9250213.1 Alpha/Beta hydrolase protein [Emericellopsis atlantica]